MPGRTAGVEGDSDKEKIGLTKIPLGTLD